MKFFLKCSLFLLLVFCPLFFVKAETVSNISIFPDLDVSYFSPYNIKADVSGSPTSVSVSVSGLNGDGGTDWNYYADGTSVSDSVTKSMSYSVSESKYISTNIYPDSIYPEIFFATSSITWNNTPLNIDIRRNSYHLLHFNNPFSIVGNSSFFVEVNAIPRSTANSANLDVYVVKKGKEVTFFNSDWRNSPDVELVGSLDKNSVFHHTHSVGKSAHHLITLTTNADGTLGTKNLDISNDFWVVLYSNAPNISRGWDLKYQSSSLCNNNNRWYVGNQSGWQTTSANGCPDSHIHMARRGLVAPDGITATVTANYSSGSSVVETKTFSFEPLPNLPPAPTDFISPVAGAVYDGGVNPTKILNISWNEASDPNGDNLTYNLYLLDESGSQVGSPILENGTGTSIDFDITSILDGRYNIRGEVCDTEPLCKTFTLADNFIIQKTAPNYSLSDITIRTSNANDSSYAKAGDTVYLSFKVSDSGDISSTLNVYFFLNGLLVDSSVVKSNTGDTWSVSYVVPEDQGDGIIDFIITADNLDFNYSNTNNYSYVVIDTTAPSSVSSDPEGGRYRTTKNVTLFSSDASKIMYTLDGSNPTCTSGVEYVYPIEVTESKTVKAVGCDLIGNYSTAGVFIFTISRRTYGSYVSVSNINLDNILSVKKTPIHIFKNLKKGMIHEDVKKIQIYLNTHNFILVDKGPGSLGNETTYFGSLTKSAVIRFQLANKLAGDGIVGPLTLRAINDN